MNLTVLRELLAAEERHAPAPDGVEAQVFPSIVRRRRRRAGVAVIGVAIAVAVAGVVTFSVFRPDGNLAANTGANTATTAVSQSGDIAGSWTVRTYRLNGQDRTDSDGTTLRFGHDGTVQVKNNCTFDSGHWRSNAPGVLLIQDLVTPNIACLDTVGNVMAPSPVSEAFRTLTRHGKIAVIIDGDAMALTGEMVTIQAVRVH